MSALMNAGDVEVELNRLYEELELTTDELPGLGNARAEADAGHKQAYAIALLASSQSSADKRRAEAEQNTYDAYLAAQQAEEAVRAKRAEISRIEHQLDVLRTLAASHRSVT